MEILEWINRPLSAFKGTAIFQRYFEQKQLEKGTETYFILNEDLGIDIIFTPDYIVKSFHFYSQEIKGVNGFPDNLPLDLQFYYSQKKVREILGEPSYSGGGGSSFLYKVIPNWDKYIFETFYVHLQFSTDSNKINLVTVDSLLI